MKSDKVKDLYNDRASTYERVFVDFLGWGKELNAFFRRAEPIHPRFRVLDAGCGTGIVTRTLYQLALEKHYQGVLFHAFDLTQGMLDIFQTWVANQGAANIELRQADVLDLQSLPSDWKNYDLVITSAMLEYLPWVQVATALGNLRRLLNNEGVLLVFVTRRNFLTSWLAARWWKTNLYSEDEIQTLLHDSGFDKVEFKHFSEWWSGSIIAVEAKM